MKSKLLTFVKHHETWKIEERRNIMFSGEATLQKFVIHRSNMKRTPDKRFDEMYTNIQFSYWSTDQAQWLKCHLHILNWKTPVPASRKMRCKWYGNTAAQTGTRMRIHQFKIFIQDGVPWHRSSVVQRFLQQDQRDIIWLTCDQIRSEYNWKFLRP